MMGSLIESLLSIFAGHKKTPLTLALKHQGRSLLRGTTLLRPDLAVRTFPSADTLSRDHGRSRRSLCSKVQSVRNSKTMFPAALRTRFHPPGSLCRTSAGTLLFLVFAVLFSC